MPPSASGNVERTVPSVAPAVGGREDLLGRHVDDVRDAVDGLLGAGQPAVPLGIRPTREVGARAAEADRVEAALVEQWRRARWSRSMCSRQAATGSGSSRRVAVDHRVPEPLDVGLAEDRVRPSPRSGSRRSSTGSAGGSRRRGASRRRAAARVRWARRWSRSARSSGSGSPVMAIVAPRVSTRWSTSASVHGGVQSSESSGACWIRARLRCGSR